MKKLFMIAMVAVATLTANAQSKVKAGTWSIQPKAGVTIASITNMDGFGTDDANVYVGATIGGEAEYQITDRISVAAGVGYIMQGKQWADYNYGGNKVEDNKVELGYINVPVVANFYAFKGLAFKAGVQFAFLTNAKQKYTTITGGTENAVSHDIKDACNTFDFSIPVGVSYEFDNHIVIDARYNIGITKLNKNSYPGHKDNHNSVFLATVGYKFRL